MSLKAKIKAVESARSQSELVWEQAAETGQAEGMEMCLEAYDMALEELKAGHIKEAYVYLEEARKYEYYGGDDQYARRAMEALS